MRGVHPRIWCPALVDFPGSLPPHARLARVPGSLEWLAGNIIFRIECAWCGNPVLTSIAGGCCVLAMNFLERGSAITLAGLPDCTISGILLFLFLG